ncbi:MFS transporter [Methylobacterium brachiatum]|uniref:MFS transporter n=1 Tax=Methylobacterium brachiatum TaxID=269660 RepID=UPI002448E256|nr:MFS transporter [Methylobacterium brachiatum]MDH2314086.1 MFS transporter [Methylobacterium brachiatum]
MSAPVAAARATPSRDASQMYKAVIASSIGNALEFYDLTLYLYFAVTISKLFFPSSNPTTSLLLALGSFGISYLMRPLGAIVLGLYADRVGRKPALMLSILLMMVGTFMMVVMPSYESIGIFASIGVLAARLIQGFSVGGEFGASTAFMVEHGPARKGFFASFQFASQGLASVMAALSGVILSATLSPDQIASWGWRLPFAFGLLIGPVGLYIRRNIAETPEFEDSTEGEATNSPMRDLFVQQWLNILLATGLVATSTALNYMISYTPTYAVNQLGLPSWIGFVASFVGAVMLMTVAPLVGHWSDSIGRTPIMRAVVIAVFVLMFPAFALLISYPALLVIVPVLALIGALKASYSAALPALMAEIFPTRTRSTGMNISYNVGVTLFGGFAPFWIESLIAITHTALAPSFFLMFAASVSLLCIVLVRRTFGLR